MDEKLLLEKVERLQKQVRKLAKQNGVLRVERDMARDDLRARVPKATPEETEAYLKDRAAAVPGDLDALIETLERGEVPHGGR